MDARDHSNRAFLKNARVIRRLLASKSEMASRLSRPLYRERERERERPGDFVYPRYVRSRFAVLSPALHVNRRRRARAREYLRSAIIRQSTWIRGDDGAGRRIRARTSTSVLKQPE